MIFQNRHDTFFDYERMQPFGRIGYAAKRLKFQKKFTPKAFPLSFIGYPDNHASDSYKMYNHVTRQAVITRYISKWEEFNREIITKVVPLFDEELISQHKLMKIMNKAEETTGLQGVEFEEDEIDEVELEALTKLQSENSNGGPNLIPADDTDSDDDDNFVPILGQRTVVHDDDNDEQRHHVIVDGEEEDSDSDNDADSDADPDRDDEHSNGNSDDDDDNNEKLQRELAKLDADLDDIDLNEGIRTRSRAYPRCRYRRSCLQR
jgi:hypothetical protein